MTELKTHTLRLLGINILTVYYQNRFGWFRFFGRGLKWKDIRLHEKLFSERYEHTKYVMIGNWLIGYLK